MSWQLRLVSTALVSLLLASAAPPLSLLAQSSHLNALEGAAPAPVVEPLAGIMRTGLAGLWTDPTTAPRNTGVFFSVHQSSYASLRVVQAIAAFRMGPRWSLTMGQSEIPNLFDTSFTNGNPGLGALRAQGGTLGLDATAGVGRFHTSAGVALYRDDNVGDLQSSSVARLHVRYSVTSDITVGARGARVVGGSIAEAPGRLRLDATMSHTWGGGALQLQAAAAVSHGRLWRFGETDGGAAVACLATIRSVLQLGVGAGRYSTTFGEQRHSWYRAGVVSVHVTNVRVSASFTSTDLGAGSGYAISVGYEPGLR